MAVGRVCTGFSLPYIAKYAATGGTITYSDVQKLARGVSVSIEPESSDSNNFYADNVLAESVTGTFTGGTATVTVDGLLAAAEALIMGLPESTTVNTVEVLQYGDSANPPYLGFGFLARYMSDGVTTYVPYVLTKVKFQIPSTEANTQEDEIDWQTQELTATVMRDDSAGHNWKMIGATDYSTEAEAETALRKMLGAT